jgi:putative endonuclease
VKARRTDEFGAPDRAVDREKQLALVHAAREYARRARIEWNQVRFDVVSVVFGDPPALTYVKDAFPPEQAL